MKSGEAGAEGSTGPQKAMGRGKMLCLLEGWSRQKTPVGRFIDEEAATWKPDMKAVEATIDFAT